MGGSPPEILVKALMGGWADMSYGGFSSWEEAIAFCSQGEEYFAALSKEEDDLGGALTEDQSQRGQVCSDKDDLIGGFDMNEYDQSSAERIPHLSSSRVLNIVEGMFSGMTDNDLKNLSERVKDELENRNIRKESWVGGLAPEEILADGEKKNLLGCLSESNPQGRSHSVRAVVSLQKRAYAAGVYLSVLEAKKICDEFFKRFKNGEILERHLPIMDERNEFDKTGLLPEQVLTAKEKYLLGKSWDGKSPSSEAEEAYSEAFTSVENRLGWKTGTVSGLLMFYQARVRCGLTELVIDPPDNSEVEDSAKETRGFIGDLGLDDQETFLD